MVAEPTLVEANRSEYECGRTNPAERAAEELRALEALWFARLRPPIRPTLAKRMPDGVDIKVSLANCRWIMPRPWRQSGSLANKMDVSRGRSVRMMTRKSRDAAGRAPRSRSFDIVLSSAGHTAPSRGNRGVVPPRHVDVCGDGWSKPRGRRKRRRGRPLPSEHGKRFMSQCSWRVLGDMPGLERTERDGICWIRRIGRRVSPFESVRRPRLREGRSSRGRR